MVAVAQDFEQIRDSAAALDPMMEAADAARALVARVLELWNQQQPYLVSGVPGGDRDKRRAVASTLRAAEGAMGQVLVLGAMVSRAGHCVEGLDQVVAAHLEARKLLTLPLARRMAERDPEGRTAEDLATLIVRAARFDSGRPVITEQLAETLPCPFDPEPEAAA